MLLKWLGSLFGDTRFVFEVVAFLFYDKRPVLDEGVDSTDVFADYAQAEELDGGEEEQADDQGGGAYDGGKIDTGKAQVG